MKGLKAILYVQSRRETEVIDRSYWGYVVQYVGGGAGAGGGAQPRIIPDYKVLQQKIHRDILPDDQKALVKMVKAAARKYRFELKVIDVTKEDALHKLENRLKGISTFPALVTDRGLKIEGDITEEQIKALFTSALTRSRTTVR